MKWFLTVALSLALWGCSGSKTVTTEAGSSNSPADIRVWVNTSSGVYHCPGTKWYGATRQGVYMAQSKAKDSGYRPAYGKECQ